MLHDPRDLVRELEDQGCKVTNDKDENGVLKYWITLPNHKQYGLRAQDLFGLKHEGKLNAAGIAERG